MSIWYDIRQRTSEPANELDCGHGWLMTFLMNDDQLCAVHCSSDLLVANVQAKLFSVLLFIWLSVNVEVHRRLCYLLNENVSTIVYMLKLHHLTYLVASIALQYSSANIAYPSSKA
jgi:hypothetical protein